MYLRKKILMNKNWHKIQEKSVDKPNIEILGSDFLYRWGHTSK